MKTLGKLLRGLFGVEEVEVHPEIESAQADLEQLDRLAERDAEIRERLNARLAILSAELDNLTRRGGMHTS